MEDLTTGRDSAAFTVTDVFARSRVDGPLLWSGNIPARAGRALERAGFDVRALLDSAGATAAAGGDGAGAGATPFGTAAG